MVIVAGGIIDSMTDHTSAVEYVSIDFPFELSDVVHLYSIKDGDEVFIGSSTLSSEETHRKIIFANLTSASNYKIGVSVGSLEESITIKIADE